MLRTLAIALGAVALTAIISQTSSAQQPNAFGNPWAIPSSTHNWERFYHYPYVYYPQNFWGNEYYRSVDNLYYRYPPEMRVPVYNKRWHNFYPTSRRYHQGHHFILDVF